MVVKCLILASGFGTRLYPLTRDKAKALIEYKGKPLLTYIVERVPQNIDIFVGTNRKFEMDFRRWQKTINRKIEIGVEDVWTEKEKKGALGSLTYSIEQANINEDLLILASDNYFEFDLSQFISAYNGKNALVAVHDTGDKSKASQFGVVEIDKDRIVSCEEKPDSPKTSLVGIACYIFPPRLFPILSGYHHDHPELDELGHFVAHLVECDEVDAYIFTEVCQDVASIISDSREVITSREYR